MNVGVMFLFKLVFFVLFCFFLDKYLGRELLDHMVVLFSVFWEVPILFSIVAAPFTFLLTM